METEHNSLSINTVMAGKTGSTWISDWIPTENSDKQGCQTLDRASAESDWLLAFPSLKWTS